MNDNLKMATFEHPPAVFLETPDLREVKLVSFSQPSPGLDPSSFLRQARGLERFYWRDGRQPVTYAGFGVTANLMGWGENRFNTIRRKARELFSDAVLSPVGQPLAGPRLFGGFAFRDDFLPDITWSVFNPAHFILPHYQLTQVGEESWLTINALLPSDEDPLENLPQLQDALAARYALLQTHEPHLNPPDRSEMVAIDYPMSYPVWEQKINGATQAIRSGQLNKVVLSRVCEIRFNKRVDVDSALAYLDRQYAGCYRFLFEPRAYHAFYGATPELLADVGGRSVVTMSLAGSIRRGAAPSEDEALAKQMLNDPKERHEHQLVVEAVRRRLAPLAEQLDIPAEPTVHKLSNIQHLLTPIRARLLEPNGVLPIVESLHPTPALGGSPRQQAISFIREAEPVPRGWYAAPIGTIDHNLDGCFAVAIRSAVSQERRVWLYAGAGIVADSVPQKEWEETSLKFMPMLNALNLQIEGSRV